MAAAYPRLVLRRVYDATWGRLFALGYDFFFAVMERNGLRELRRELLTQAEGRCLEIGAGSGLNLEHWPRDVELVASEPFEPMANQLRKKVRDGRPGTEVVIAPGEALPFPDDSFDTVGLTLVLCTAPDPEAVLREVQRVLKPGGRFLFLEHVRARDESLARWQDRLHGPWYVFGHGCHCNRDTPRMLAASGLEVSGADWGELPGAVPLVRPMYKGVARAD
jgi:ubiquinone/menaquinone biosynthesis C-methylase UbiE